MTSLLLALALAADVSAPPSDLREPDAGSRPDAAQVRAFCDYTTASASSESLHLMLPDLFARTGWTHGTEQVTGVGVADALVPFATVGLRYDLAQLLRGRAMRRLGEAECDRYRVESALRAFADKDFRVVTRRALQARQRVVEDALPRAAELIQAARDAVRVGATTVAELNALELRVDSLRLTLDQTRRGLATLPMASPDAVQPVGALLERRRAAEVRVVETEGSIRRSRAWELSFRGGYEQVFQDNDTRIPFFGVITLSVNPSLLFQGADDDRAVRARREWLATDEGGLEARVEQLQRELAALAAAGRSRLAELSVILADLETRLRDIEAIRSERIQRYRDHLWLDRVQARAEEAFLRAHLEDVGALVDPAASGR